MDSEYDYIDVIDIEGGNNDSAVGIVGSANCDVGESSSTLSKSNQAQLQDITSDLLIKLKKLVRSELDAKQLVAVSAAIVDLNNSFQKNKTNDAAKELSSENFKFFSSLKNEI